jgi:hypothetical protein
VINISLTVNRNSRAQQNAGIRLNIRRVVRQDKVIRLLTFGTNRFLRQHMRRRIGQRRIRQGHGQYRIRR